MLVYFRKRITPKLINEINRRVVEVQQEKEENIPQEEKKKKVNL